MCLSTIPRQRGTQVEYSKAGHQPDIIRPLSDRCHALRNVKYSETAGGVSPGIILGKNSGQFYPLGSREENK
jgi:hypothetical protein